MQALKRHYEKYILALFLIGLVVLSIHLLTGLQEARNRTIKGDWTPGADRRVQPLTDEDFRALQILNDPQVTWHTRFEGLKGSLFYPGKYIWCANPKCQYWIPNESEICLNCGRKQGDAVIDVPQDEDADGDGIRDEIENQYDFLDPNDPRDAHADQDGDWFTNLEEINAGTAPDDPASHPPLARLLRLLSVSRDRFRIQFENLIVGRADDPKEKWDIVLRVVEDGQHKTRFVKLGAEVQGYKITGIERKTERVFSKQINDYVQQDVSELTLVGAGGEQLALRRGMPTYTGMAVRLFLHTDVHDLRIGRAIAINADEVLELVDTVNQVERYTLKVQTPDEVMATLVGSDDVTVRITREPPRKPQSRSYPGMLPPEGGAAWPGMPDGGAPMMPAMPNW